jgi:hypothetical protein
VEETFDMVVLAVGLAPNKEAVDLAKTVGIDLNEHLHAATHTLEPVVPAGRRCVCLRCFPGTQGYPPVGDGGVRRRRHGHPAAGFDARGTLIRTKELPPELDVSEQEPRVGVFVCNCGINIGGVADVPAVREYAATLPHVVHVEDNLFTCSQDTQDKMKEVITRTRHQPRGGGLLLSAHP